MNKMPSQIEETFVALQNCLRLKEEMKQATIKRFEEQKGRDSTGDER